jgi:hypothetical protein
LTGSNSFPSFVLFHFLSSFLSSHKETNANSPWMYVTCMFSLLFYGTRSSPVCRNFLPISVFMIGQSWPGSPEGFTKNGFTNLGDCDLVGFPPDSFTVRLLTLSVRFHASNYIHLYLYMISFLRWTVSRSEYDRLSSTVLLISIICMVSPWLEYDSALWYGWIVVIICVVSWSFLCAIIRLFIFIGTVSWFISSEFMSCRHICYMIEVHNMLYFHDWVQSQPKV